MERVRARLTNRVYDSARCLTIFGRVVACQHREFLNGVHAQVNADHAARGAVAVIVDAEPVQTIIVLRRSAAGDGQLRTKSAVPAPRAGFEA